MKKSTMILLGVLAVTVIIISMLGGSYNSLVTKQEQVDKELANIDVQLMKEELI